MSNRWLLTILLAVLVPALGPGVVAQNALIEPDKETPQVPTPGSLTPGWWAYLGDAGDELPQRAEALHGSIDAAVLSLMVADSPEAVERAREAKREIQAYVDARINEPPVNPLTLKTTGLFTLEEFLEARGEVRRLERDIQRAQVERAELDDLRGLERRKVDNQFTRYLGLTDPVERINLGLLVIADRALLAVTELRLQRKQGSIAALRSRQQSYDQQAQEARRNLSPEGFDLTFASETLKRQQTELKAAEDATRSAKNALLDLDPAAENAEFRGDYVRQRLLEANLKQSSAALRLAITRASIAWYQLVQPESDADIDQAQALLDEFRPMVERVRSERASWQRSAEQFLLIEDEIVTRDRELRLLRDRSRELSRQNLLGLRELDRLFGQFTDVRDLLEASIASRQGGVSGVWRRLALVSGDLWARLGDIAGMSLFRLGDVPVTPSAILRMVAILFTAWLISWLFRRGLERLGRRRHLADRSSLYLLGRVAHYVFVTVGIFLALTQLGFNFTSVALVAGALSVGIGFGLQNIVNNFVSGLILMFDRSLKIGDYIELDSGLTGIVREIKVRSTRINTNDNVDVLVPNAEFFGSRLVNWTHTDGMARFRIPFGVAYGSDKEKVKEAVLQAAEDVDYTLHNMPGKEPDVWMTGFGDSSLDFVLLVWVSRQGVRRPTRVRSAYYWAMETRLREAGIEIPFPQRDLHMRSGFFRPPESDAT
jgi:small-conductance mechanosensitive channel